MGAESHHDDRKDHDVDGVHGQHPVTGRARAARWARREIFVPHSHDVAEKVDQAMESSREGTRALKVSFLALAVTALAQAVVVVLSGSVALLGDTLHNLADALTAVPLGVAFVLGRQPATRRYTYGYGRAEDLAGIAVVAAVAVSAGFAGYESLRRLFEPRDVNYLGAVAAAGMIGFAGNELVARYRIGVGRRIGSAALVADGLHARTDGFTSLAVVAGAFGTAVGFDRADPLAGLVVTVAILAVLRSAAREVLGRLMDAVDPGLVEHAEEVLSHVEGVQRVGSLRLRWIGHSLHAEADLVVDQDLTVARGHCIAEAARHRLLEQVPRLTNATIHTDPCGHDGSDAHHWVRSKAG